MKKSYLFLSLLISLFSCQSKQKVDLIVRNAVVYTVDEQFSVVEAFAVKDGRFIETGTSEQILSKYAADAVIDAGKKAVFPGFNDAHAHFYGYGSFLQEANLVGTKSFEEILAKLSDHRKQNPDRKWILGRGWDQNDWEKKEFPEKSALDSLFPDKPVLLVRIDGHAALVNQKAIELAGLNQIKEVPGGLIEKKGGQLTGILIDNAIGLVRKQIPPPTETEIEKALLDAQKNCFAVGLTSIADAGLDKKIIEIIDRMHKEGKLQMRIYAMISGNQANLDYYLEKGPYKSDFLTVSSFKIYADGALGSRGACLLKPYTDQPAQSGFLLASTNELEVVIKRIAKKGFQANTHCIGDSANRFILDLYGKYLKGKNDRRWRIEHAQVVDKADVKKFGMFSVIPSVQPTHCTSDMYWAGDRLGKERLKNAYAFKDLLEQNGMLAFGSDFPVEDINPLFGFFAAVVRQDKAGFPEGGFQMENAVDRKAALKAMTSWAAYAAFEEKDKGSISKNKFADFVILEKDLMSIPLKETRDVKVWKTFVAGKMVFENKKTK